MQFVDLGIMDFKEHLNTVSTRQRSQFLERCFGTSCGFAATLLLATQAARRACGQELPGDVVGKRLFGRIEKNRRWSLALVSTPFTAGGKAGDLSTHNHNGLIVGKEKIFLIDKSHRNPVLIDSRPPSDRLTIAVV